MPPKPKPFRSANSFDRVHVYVEKSTSSGSKFVEKTIPMAAAGLNLVPPIPVPAVSQHDHDDVGIDNNEGARDDTDYTIPDPASRAPGGKTQNAYLEDFVSHQPAILNTILSRYQLTGRPTCSRCRENIARWRCRNCHLQQLLCRGCCRTVHMHLPFHRIEFWTGQYFHSAALWQVGLGLNVLHQGTICELLTSRITQREKVQITLDDQEQSDLRWQPWVAKAMAEPLDAQFPNLQKESTADAEVPPGPPASEQPAAPTFPLHSAADNAADALPDLMEVESVSDCEQSEDEDSSDQDDMAVYPSEEGESESGDSDDDEDMASDTAAESTHGNTLNIPKIGGAAVNAREISQPAVYLVADADEDTTVFGDAGLVEDPGDDDAWEDEIDEEAMSDRLPAGDGIPRDDDLGNPFVLVVDSSGVHYLPIVLCSCHGDGQPLHDCIFAGLFPSTFKRIQTLFTFACLDDFRLANLESKTSAYQYYQQIRRKTNPAFPSLVRDRYAELRRVSRQWRHLKKLKMHGFGHDDNVPTNGSLAIFCPACPQPGVNLPPDWESEKDLPIYTRSFVADGNFTADHLRQKRPADDIWLLDGEGMMTNRKRYETHLAIAKDTISDEPCERNFRAIALANMSSTSSDATGIVAIACARHGNFAPGALVDLQKGERQANVDWAFVEALNSTNVAGLPNVQLFYDIYCQYSKNFHLRVGRNPFLKARWPAGVTLDGGIGLFHVHGHQDKCLYRYATNFIPAAGSVDGEVLERLWSVLNLISRSTRTATLANRAETLNDHMGDNNWKKLIGIVSVICKRYRKAVHNQQVAEEYYHGLTREVDAGLVTTWRAGIEYAEANRIKNPELMDKHMEAQIPKPPSQVDIRIALTSTGHGPRAADVTWLAAGLKLEEDQLELDAHVYRLGRYPSKAARLDLNGRRDRLREAIDRFHTEGSGLMQVQVDTTDGNNIDSIPYYYDSELEDAPQANEQDILHPPVGTIPEKLKLGLPSSFASPQGPTALTSLRAAELELRQGQANDALMAIRFGISQKSFQYTKALREADRKGLKTRARDALETLGRQISTNRRVYTRCRQAMISLGMSSELLTNKYKILDNHDLHTSTAIRDPNEPGQSQFQLSWIWRIGHAGGLDQGNFLVEFRRVHWLRARAQFCRWTEELNINEKEMEWTARYFLTQAADWEARRIHSAARGSAGAIAFCHKQIAMWEAMKLNAEAQFSKVNLQYRPVVM